MPSTHSGATVDIESAVFLEGRSIRLGPTVPAHEVIFVRGQCPTAQLTTAHNP